MWAGNLVPNRIPYSGLTTSALAIVRLLSMGEATCPRWRLPVKVTSFPIVPALAILRRLTGSLRKSASLGIQDPSESRHSAGPFPSPSFSARNSTKHMDDGEVLLLLSCGLLTQSDGRWTQASLS